MVNEEDMYVIFYIFKLLFLEKCQVILLLFVFLFMLVLTIVSNRVMKYNYSHVGCFMLP